MIEEEVSTKATEHRGAVCPVCHEGSGNMLVARCGHVSCQPCWDTLLATKLECPICRQLVRRKQLRQLHL